MSYPPRDDDTQTPPPGPDQPPASAPNILGYAGTQTLPIYDNNKRAKTAIVSLRAYAVLQIVLVVGSFALALYMLTAGVDESDLFNRFGPLLGVIMLLGLIGMVSFIAFVLSTIYYMMWQYRAYWNVRVSGSETRYTPGWSVGWWFIPIANLFVPRGVLSNLWTMSGAEARTGYSSRPNTLYFLWVGYFLLSVAGSIVDLLVQFEVVPLAAEWASLPVTFGAAVAWIVFLFLLASYVADVQETQPSPTVP